ncbi:MAG: mitochondrial fission ELM1 family protein [Robiginitomaculum sp.]|nr:mitochondrial fission ELM1 family protein [Robiginitomaculum sp.]MDQ7077795.1 mitochondrial fission ELM1 family protein [Robiginitomaculum sp.]
MSPGSHGKLVIWTIDDGRIGLANQTRGLAEAIGALVPAKIRPFVVKRKLFNLGRAGKPTPDMTTPWPDICIGCGRASIPYVRSIRHWTDGRALTVQLQDPRKNPKHFDLVIPPQHDGLEGENIFSILGSPTRITPALLEAAAKDFADKMKAYPRPHLAVLLGGNSKHHKFTPKITKRLIKSLQGLLGNQVSLLITTSRRTPKRVIRALRRQFADQDQAWLWTGAPKDGPNPYFAFLQEADAVLVTNDSTNMLTEAASVGRPILLFNLEGKEEKFNQLYESLAGEGLARPFTGSLATWPVEPLDETNRAAKEVVCRLYVRLKENKNV